MKLLIAILILLRPAVLLAADPFVRFEEKGKVGLKDDKGKIIIPASFEALGWSDGSFSVIGQVTGYKMKDRWGLINLQKQFITQADFESLTYPGGDRLIASHKINPFTTKFGCVDLSGKLTVPFHYDGISVSGLRAVVFIKNGTTYEYGLIDLDDRGIIPLRYRQVYPIGTLRYAVENIEKKTALFSEQGNQLTEFAIDSISSFHQGLAVIYQNFVQGIIDRDGEVKVEPTYREASIGDDGMVRVRAFDEWKILDAQNHELQTTHADRLEESDNGVYRITLAGKSGLVTRDLKPLLPLTYDYLGREDHGNRVVGLRSYYGILRRNGSLLLPIEYDSLELERNFVRAAKIVNYKMAWALYDTFGIQKTSSFFDYLGRWNGKFFPVSKRGYWGAINRYGEEFIHCVFDSLLETNGDLIAVKFRSQFGIINKEEKWLLPPQPFLASLINEDIFIERHDSITFVKNFKGETIYFTTNPIHVAGDHLKEVVGGGTEHEISFQGVDISRKNTEVNSIQVFEEAFAVHEGMRRIKKNGKYGFVDLRGRLIIANRYDDIGDFQEGLAPVKLIGKWGYVSVEDEVVINPNYESVEPFFKGLAIVWRNKKAGLIDKEGKVLLALRYDSIRRLHDDSFLLTSALLYGLADPRGNVQIDPRFDHFEYLENGYVIVGREGNFGLVTTQGLSTIPMVYNQLVFDPESGHYLAWKKSGWKEIKLN